MFLQQLFTPPPPRFHLSRLSHWSSQRWPSSTLGRGVAANDGHFGRNLAGAPTLALRFDSMAIRNLQQQQQQQQQNNFWGPIRRHWRSFRNDFFLSHKKKRNKIHFGNSFTTSFFCFFFCNRFQSRIHAVDWVWSNHGAIISGRFALGQWRTGTGVLRFRVVVVCYVRGPSCWIDDHSGIPSCPLVRSDGNETKISTKKKKETPAIAKKMAQTHTPPPPLVSVSLFVGCVVFENSPHVVFFFIDRQIGELFFY